MFVDNMSGARKDLFSLLQLCDRWNYQSQTCNAKMYFNVLYTKLNQQNYQKIIYILYTHTQPFHMLLPQCSSDQHILGRHRILDLALLPLLHSLPSFHSFRSVKNRDENISIYGMQKLNAKLPNWNKESERNLLKCTYLLLQPQSLN